MTEGRFHFLSLSFALLGLVLYISDLSKFSFVRAVTETVNAFISPLLRFTEVSAWQVENLITAYLKNVEAQKENILLKKKLEEMLLLERELEACRQRVETLSASLKTPLPFKRLNYDLTRIIYYDPSGFDLFVIIEGGKDRGFKEGDLVVTKEKVVGMVERVFASTSRVITPFSDKFSAMVKVGKRRYIYKGGFPEGNLLHVKKEVPIKKGAKVFLGVGEARPPYFLLGKVTSVKRGTKPFFKEVKVKPLIDLRAEDFVFVIGGKR